MSIEHYFRELQSVPVADSTEHTHRAALEGLLKTFAAG